MAGTDESPQENRNEHPWHEPVVHDKRRIDPVTGKVRHPEEEPQAGAGPDSGGLGSGADPDALLDAAGAASDGTAGGAAHDATAPEDAAPDAAAQQAADLAAERLADLQRITAEFANYRKRVDGNRVLERERTVGDVASALLPVLDDLDRAEKHGDLADERSAFATIAAKLRGVAGKLGLVRFGAAGEPFDHNMHDALFQKPDPEVARDTIAEVVEPGYTLGSTLVRAAKVVVATPQQAAND